MESILPVKKALLKTATGLSAADVATDQKYLYILEKRFPKVLRFSLEGEALGEFTTLRKYTRFCYDEKERCFWAVCGSGQTIYRLTMLFVEEGRFASGLQDVSIVQSLKLVSERRTIIVTTGLDVYEVYPIGFSRHLLRSSYPLLLFDQLSGCRMAVRLNQNCEIMLFNPLMTEYKKIDPPEGFHFIGETCIGKEKPELLILFGKYGRESVIYSYSDAVKEPGSFALEEILPLISVMNFTEGTKSSKDKKKPAVKEATAAGKPAAETAETQAEPSVEMPKSKPDETASLDDNPWGFVGDILKMSGILGDQQDGK